MYQNFKLFLLLSIFYYRENMFRDSRVAVFNHRKLFTNKGKLLEIRKDTE